MEPRPEAFHLRTSKHSVETPEVSGGASPTAETGVAGGEAAGAGAGDEAGAGGDAEARGSAASDVPAGPGTRDPRGRSVQAYCGKALCSLADLAKMAPREVAATEAGGAGDTWKLALYWALGSRFWGCSPSLRPDEGDEDGESEALPQVPLAGTIPPVDLPDRPQTEADRADLEGVEAALAIVRVDGPPADRLAGAATACLLVHRAGGPCTTTSLLSRRMPHVLAGVGCGPTSIPAHETPAVTEAWAALRAARREVLGIPFDYACGYMHTSD